MLMYRYVGPLPEHQYITVKGHKASNKQLKEMVENAEWVMLQH